MDFAEGRVDEIFADFDQCHLPGLAVGIAIGGRPVYRKGFGLASMDLPISLSPSMRIRIGSTTKQFTCLAYMLLCEEGRAGVDDPLGKHLPEVNPSIHAITIRQLMGNVGGLRDALGIISEFRGHLNAHVLGRPTANEEVLSFYRDVPDIDFEPGTAWAYNNGGFLLLSLLIERIAGQTLERFMHERIFEPLGMHDTLLRRLDTDFVPNSATPHHLNAAGKYQRAYFGYDYAGAGAIVSTADDMLRWLANMGAPTVGSKETWRTMTTAQRLHNGASTGYGLGLCIDRYRGVETIHHAGGWVGSSTQMLKVPAAKLDIIVMANRGDAPSSLLVNRILDACLPGLHTVRTLRTSSIATGLFRSPQSGCVIQLLEKDRQQIASIDGLDIALELDEEGILRSSGPLAVLKRSITLVGDPLHPTSLHYEDCGASDDLVPVQTGQSTKSDRISGRYRWEAAGIEVTIASDDRGSRMTASSRFGNQQFSLENLADGIWRASPKDHGAGILSFDRDGSQFTFSNIFMRALPFRRSS